MKHIIHHTLYIIAIALLATSCNPYTPRPRTEFPATYTLAYQEIYGHCYDSIPYPIVALDLYSDGIELDKNHRITGTGYNLYLSDILVPDSLLAEGEYHSLRPTSDTLHSTLYTLHPTPFTFLPGKDYEGTPHGMYILRIDDSKVSAIHVLDSGSFVYRNDSLRFTLYYHNVYGRVYTYQPTFSGTLIPWLKK